MFFGIIKFYAVFLLAATWSLTAGLRTPVDFPITDPKVATAVERAAGYLWQTMQADHWNNLSPRVAVALAFAQRAGIDGQWLSGLGKEVAIHTKMAIVRGNSSLSLFDLSQHVNALYATCQDPRRFHGLDLVRILRTQADAANKIEHPFVLLTLCLANQTDRQDFTKLWNMYLNVRDDTLGSKALIVMGLVCLSNAQRLDIDRVSLLTEFKRSALPLLTTYDIYTKILHIQAFHALLRHKPALKLALHQSPDGSFGDVLATYYAVPALLNASLLDLRCKTANYVEPPASTVPESRRGVVYSLWMEKGDAHSMPLPLRGNETFLDLMKAAQTKNRFFRFLSDVTSDGVKVYSIGDVPNDVETAKAWTLYRGKEGQVKFHSKKHLARQNQGVDRIYPASGDHLVFWYERSSTR